jgi:Flp pilus assembly protein TadG
MSIHRIKSVYKFFGFVAKNDTGSAVVEFVILAIPLFLPIMIYLGVIHQNASILADLGSLARQSARAFITSPSENFEDARMQTVLELFRKKILEPEGISAIPVISITCSATPCLTPDSKVKVQVTLTKPASQLSGIFRFLSTPNSTFTASNTQIVDAWR